jgi:hypothetical protein
VKAATCGESTKEVIMTKLWKLFGPGFLALGGAKASTLGIGGLVEEDENSRFNP